MPGVSLHEIREPHFAWPPCTPAVEAALLAQARDTLSISNNSGIIASFERQFAEYHGRRHAVTFNSGTSALFAAFFALELQLGDNVIVPDYTFFATASPLMFFPIEVRLADCDSSGNMLPSSVDALIDARTRAVVVTHLWGVPCDVDQIAKTCGEMGIRLIEDCSHSHGAQLRNRLCGSFGDVAAWSLQGQKLVSGGEGGILVTDDSRILEMCLLLGHYNKRCLSQIESSATYFRYAVTGFGLKLRAHPLAIAVAQHHFSLLESYIAGRARCAAVFLEALRAYDFIELPDISHRSPSWYSLAFQFDESRACVSRAQFLDLLARRGCREIEAPGSTRRIADYPLFRQPPSELGVIARCSNWHTPRPGSARYDKSVVKMPVWTFRDEDRIAALYLEALVSVCEAVRSRRV